MSPTARRVATIAVVGLATGALTQIGQGTLPEGWSQAANAISPWLLVAFLLASTMPDRRWAIVAGIATLLLAVVGYYAMVQIRFGYGGGTGSLVFWTLGGFVGGVVYGLAGHGWRTGGRWTRTAAIGLMAAVFVAEGLYLGGILPDPAIGRGFVIVGAVVPLVLGRSWPDRMWGYVAVLPALALGALGYVVFQLIYAVTAGIG